MQQMDLFDKEERLIRDELSSMHRQIRGLFARFNYLEQEFLDVMQHNASRKELESTVL